jgi:nucleoside-diphosphate-sugar epimerase
VKGVIAVLGASGVYGRHLTPRLVDAGYRVRALVRRPEAATSAAACGAEIHTADIFDSESLCRALDGCAVGINLATSLPGPSGRGDFVANDRLRREGTPIWVRACEESGVARILQQSVAMINGAAGDGWCDEDTPFAARAEGPAVAAIAAALEMEEAVRRSQLDWSILRGGLFYGPGTGFDEGWLARARAGKLRLPAEPDAFVSLVHIADMAAATVAALDRWPERRALIVADDEPVRWRDLLNWVAASVGAPAPQPGQTPGFPSFRARNVRAREALAWAPFYANYRMGLAW